MKINFEKKEIYYRILIFLPSPIIFAKRSNPSSLHQPLISRGEYTVANKAARLSVHVTCPRGARTSSAVFRRSAASLSRLLRVITRPLREAFLRLPGGKSSRKLDRIPLTPLASLVSASEHPPPPSKTGDNVSAFCRATVLWKHADSTSELKKEGGGRREGRALNGSCDGIAFNSRVFGRCSSSFWGDEDFSS